MKTYQKRISILLALIIAISAITAAVPAGSAAETQTVQTSDYSIPNPIFSLTPAVKGVLVSWNTDSRVDHYRVYHKTETGWNMIADNIKVGYYFDVSTTDGISHIYTVRGLNSANEFVTDFERYSDSCSNAPKSSLYLLGDVDLDGVVSLMDATIVQKILADLKMNRNGYEEYLADSNDDGLDASDATWIQRYITQIPIPYPVGGTLINLSAYQPATEKPTTAPTEAPTQAPTQVPTQAPTQAPTVKPTEAPAPTEAPNYQYEITNVRITKKVDTYYYSNNDYPDIRGSYGYQVSIDAPNEIPTFKFEYNKNNETDKNGKLIWHNVIELSYATNKDEYELITNNVPKMFTQRTNDTKYKNGDIIRIRIFGTNSTSEYKGTPYNQITPTVETSFTWNENEFTSIGNKYRNNTPAKDIPLSEYTIRDEEREMLDWINEYRRKQSFKDGNPYRNELTLSPALCRVARMRAEALADNWDESHVVEGSHDVYPYGSLIATVNKYCGHDTRPIVYGENIASYAGMPYNAVYGWASHESHYLTMVNANYDVAGIGYCEKKGIWVFIAGAGATWQDQDEDNENYQAWMARMPLNAQYPVNFWDE
ncbi:CAP domain-containing protein [Ruminococcus sp.]|uniref:CAP domain-containing protein n=1 Tax=Ruminococcus sp. TaxID=41978 RepID=UPI002E819D1F|nr:CAP domain-containing protein [Ruminococcus sp.]MEE3492723.1 CAP domain-containing protein [Ruminococcus sp.]